MKRLPGLFNDSFDEVFKDPFFSRNMEYMKTDIREKDNTYILEVELPGYQKKIFIWNYKMDISAFKLPIIR